MHTRSLPVFTNQTLWRSVASILFFTALTALAARITIFLPFTPVPVTMQVLAVVLTGLVLGARSGAMSQLAYLGLIAVGLPFDASGVGPVALVGPTAGYLFSYVPAAFAVGLLAEKFSTKNWWGNFVAAIAGVAVIYLGGASWLAVYLGSWSKAFWGGVAPFVVIDVLKAGVAAGVAESGKLLLRR